MPSLYIITVSTGAGKSSIGRVFLPEAFQDLSIFNGDKIFLEKRSELWRQGIKAIKEARNLAGAYVELLFDELVENALAANADFLYEGHFTNEATWDVPRRFKQAGYTIHLVFLGLANIDLSEARVVDRAKTGGHYVDPLTLSGNYYGNMEKLNVHFAIFDTAEIVDSSEPDFLTVVLLENGEVAESISLAEVPTWLKDYMPSIYLLIADRENVN